MSNLTEDEQEYQSKVENQFNLLNEQIEELKAKGAEFKDDAKIEYEAKMAELYVKREEVEIKLRELQNSGDAAWIEMQRGFEKAWEELSNAWNQALSKF